MKKNIIFTLIGFLILITTEVYGKARFMGLEETVAVSDLIAIIEVTHTETVGQPFSEKLPKKGYWNYSQKNTFLIKEIIKDSPIVLPKIEEGHILWAEKSFICAHATYKPGKYITFLEHIEANEWITLNHQFGALPIDSDNNVPAFDWYLSEKEKGKTISLKEVRKRISQATLDGIDTQCKAHIPPKLLYNAWKKNSNYQKLWFHVHEPPANNWPEGLSSFVRGFIKDSNINQEAFTKIISEGGEYNLSGYWQEGCLIIRSLQDENANN